MPVDYSKIPTEDLLALQTGKLESVSTETLRLLQSQATPEAQPESSWLEDVPSIVGGLLGGAAKTLAGRTGLSGLLAGGGEAAHQIYQHATGSPDAPQTSTDAATRIAVPLGEQSLGNIVGEGVVRGAAKIIPKVLPEYRIPGLKEAEEAIRPYMEKYLPKGMLSKKGGPGFTISQKTDPASSAAKMENIIESSFFGGTPIKKFKFAQARAVDDYAADVTDKIWKGIEKLPPSEQGAVFTRAFDIADEVFKTTSRVKYKEVDGLVGAESVNITKLKEWAGVLNEKNAQMAGVGASDAGDTLISKITNLPDRMTFANAAELRSRLLKEESSLLDNDKARGIAKKLAGFVDESMESTAKNLSPEAKEAWREANLFYKTGKEKFDNEFMYRLIRKGKDQPELVGKSIFQNGEITQIRKAKEILKDEPKTWQAMKAGYWEDIMGKSINPEGKIVGTNLHNSLKKMGDETMKEIFTPKERVIIESFKRALLTSQKQTTGGGGSMLIQLMQAPALGAAITGWGMLQQEPETIIGGLTVLATPRILGKMLVSPKYQSLFLNGLSTQKPIAMPAIAKLIAGALEMSREKTGATRSF